MNDQIDTVAALRALPVGTRIVDKFRDVATKEADGTWAFPEAAPLSSPWVAKHCGPCLVIQPENPTITTGEDPVVLGDGSNLGVSNRSMTLTEYVMLAELDDRRGVEFWFAIDRAHAALIEAARDYPALPWSDDLRTKAEWTKWADSWPGWTTPAPASTPRSRPTSPDCYRGRKR